MKPLYFLFFLLGAASASAQFVADYKRTADGFFARQDYYSAAQYYAKALENKPEYQQAVFYPYETDVAKHPSKSSKMHEYKELVYRLAESYRHYNDFASAGRWYEQATQFSADYPLARYWYAVCLRAQGRFQDALTQFQQFRAAYATQDEYQTAADKEIADCTFAVAETARTNSPFSVLKMGGNINVGGANYAPVWWSAQLLFTSSRSVVATARAAGGKSPYVNHLYFAGSDSGSARRVELPGQNMEQGVSALSPDGLTLYLTQWTVGKDGKKTADLYRSKRTGTAWSDPERVSVDATGFSSMQPAISTDGSALLFASDRPGGSGGFDLWFAALDNTGNPGTPVNLGPSVNTAGDEEAPYYDAEAKTLVFSTNGRVGMGNFDLFESLGDLSNLSAPVNLGYPLNSPKDDIYFTSAHAGGKLFKEAYISSDRASTCCLEVFRVTRRGKRISGSVVDCETHQPLDGAKVSLLDTTAGRVVGEVVLNATGIYGFDMDDPGNFKIVVSKDNYFSKSHQIHAEAMVPVDTLVDREVCLKHYEPNKPIVLQNIFYDFNKATLRQESMAVLDTLVGILDENPTMAIQMGAHTDGIGGVQSNLDLSARRAQACVDYLISHGIDPRRLTAHGFGKCCPIAPEKINGKDNPEGRQINRRTEFTVLRK
ncbi:MAG TPA: OmpA family protein [Dinghuibacter sp.]|jgi:outer membrane protein OmpA-like peptidoglycan-associated protein/tetratricopeptide (TPR) repeat protein|uniref:OmpA family protein n=1 Tax=Dinghuibacter sp. TaxID=2024697 RepID=UPI002CB899A4|nr:OmpA family protein [Dinghuibacter sp.]HTJ12413.1 OmpA family protein [Dinghuibacter sp.]